MTKKIGNAFVAGAGVGGVRAALDLAETGYHVTLIDRAPHIGGILSRLDYQFPNNRCGMCKMLPSVNRDSSSQFCLRRGLFHENIDILLGTEILSVEGDSGNFQITIREPVQLVDPKLCIGCGRCEDVCPVEVPDEFNAGFTQRKAVSLPLPHSLPNAFAIDPSVCTWCGECAKVCPTGAIQIGEGPREGFRVLVVDDELVMRDSLKEWLDEEGFSVDMAASGAEALEMLAAKSYQLMLTDIKMPGMDGVEVLEKAKETVPDLVVVMMTAYATVETAVEAMKTGALDYLMKPFDPADLIPKIHRIYQNYIASRGRTIEAGAIILSMGTDYFDPAQSKNTFGYGCFPNVITNLEFERLISNSGPAPGRFTPPFMDRPIRKIAWLQCVGSRNLQVEADFCSSVCCMIAVKEALLAKEKFGPETETAIFYMDMRTCGKSFQRYRDAAEHEQGVRFIRTRVHSVLAEDNGDGLLIRYMDDFGTTGESVFDLVVLSVGQRPAPGMAEMAEKIGFTLNSAGFPETGPFSLTKSDRDGIFLGGAFAGLKDIGDSLIMSSAAALDASRVIHSGGGGLEPVEPESTVFQDISRETLRILAVVCMCGPDKISETDRKAISWNLRKDPAVEKVLFQDRICTADGWETLLGEFKQTRFNRLLVASCVSCVHGVMRTELSRAVLLRPELIVLTDIRREMAMAESGSNDESVLDALQRSLKLGIDELRDVSPYPPETVPIEQTVVVVGGGIGGLTAALSVADHGFHVDLVEQTDRLGGNLHWLSHDIEGEPVAPLLEDTLKKVEKHPLIKTRMQTTVSDAYGEVGHFISILESESGDVETVSHGAVILATGGREAETDSYGLGTHPSIVTQMGMEQLLSENSAKIGDLKAVAMILCVDSREEPRNYCSRVCCGSALRQIFALRKINPELSVYVLYRDMMTCGFQEAYLTKARRDGTMFIPYHPSGKPVVDIPEKNEGGVLYVRVYDPVLRADVEIETDLLVLATGVEPVLPESLTSAYGAAVDEDGFFKEAEPKWRPVESLKEGVFACGLAHSPRSIPETIAQAQAAAQRALRILVKKNLPSGKVTAAVRESLCILCERCIDACPYGARSLDPDESRILVNPLMCQGCGACAAVCPNDASIVEGFLPGRMISAIDEVLA